MKKSKSLSILLLSLIIFLFGVGFSIYWSSLEYSQSSYITLPQKNPNEIEIDENIVLQNKRVAQAVTVDAKNVKSVLSQLVRPREYSFVTKTTVYSQSSVGETQAFGYVRDNISKVMRYDINSQGTHVLLTKENAYSWQQGSSTYVTSPKGAFSLDDFSCMPTYEVLLARHITHAELISDENELSIMVRAVNDISHLEETYVVSLSTGLLKSASFMDVENDRLVSRVDLLSLSLDPVDAENFKLPNGTVPVE